MNPDKTAREMWITLAKEHGWFADALPACDVVVLMKDASVLVAAFDISGGLSEAVRMRPSADSYGKTNSAVVFEDWLLNPGLPAPLPVRDSAQIVDFEHLRTFARFLVGGFPPGGTVKASEVGRMIQRFVEPQPELRA